MIRKVVIKIPPRPEVIKERYAGFLAEQAKYLENYKSRYVSGMNERFALRPQKKSKTGSKLKQ